MPSARKPPNAKIEAKFRLNADGTISNARFERYALWMADDVPSAQAWRLVGGKNDGGSNQYRREGLESAPFQQRLKALAEEKLELEKDPLFGPSLWQANQLWRHACAEGDTKLMTDAAKMRLSIAEKMADRQPKPPAAEGEVGAGRVGKKAHENPQTKMDRTSLSARLVERGVPVPKPAEIAAQAVAALSVAAPASVAPVVPVASADDVLERMGLA